jgi:hypothetical protein
VGVLGWEFEVPASPGPSRKLRKQIWKANNDSKQPAFDLFMSVSLVVSHVECH